MVLAPGEGEQIRPGVVLLGALDSIVAVDFTWDAGRPGPDLHVHHHHADGFYVLEGELLVTVAGEQHSLKPGGFALAPPDLVHAFGVPEHTGARFLNFHAPGMGFGERLRTGGPFDQHEPPADGGRPGSDAVLRDVGEGQRLALGPTSRVVKCRGTEGMESLSVHEVHVDPGFEGPALHVHDVVADGFYVLDGSLGIRVGDETTTAGPGSFALVPPGVPHTYWNESAEPVRLLSFMAPAGFDGYFHEVDAAGRTIGVEEGAEIASRYDFRAI